MKRWFVGAPLFEGNLAILALALLSALPFGAIGIFALTRGISDPVILSPVALGLGNLLLGTAETVPTGSGRANAAARGAGLLAGPVVFPALLVAGL